MSAVTRKVTLQLSAALLEGVQDVVAAGLAASQRQAIEQALAEYLRSVEMAQMKAAWDRAADDPLFLADCEEVARDFAALDAEAARRIDD